MAVAFSLVACSDGSSGDDDSGGEFLITDWKLVKMDNLKDIGIDFKSSGSINLPYVSAFASLAGENTTLPRDDANAYYFCGKLSMVSSSANVTKMRFKSSINAGTPVERELDVSGGWKNQGVSTYVIYTDYFRRGGGLPGGNYKYDVEFYLIDDSGNKSNTVSYGYAIP